MAERKLERYNGSEDDPSWKRWLYERITEGKRQFDKDHDNEIMERMLNLIWNKVWMLQSLSNIWELIL